jgi:hypothetical protein
MTADLALAADPGFLERSADPAEFVIQACERAKVWLREALEHGDISQITEVKSQAEAIRVYTMQKQLGKDAELSAAEVVRRAERGIGVALRRAQDGGDLNHRGEHEGNQYTGGNVQQDDISKPKLTDFAKKSELYGTGPGKPGIFALTDGVPGDSFDEAVAEARVEGDLSRANVARKIRARTGSHAPQSGDWVPEPGDRAGEAPVQRRKLIRAWAGQGYSSRQMASLLGMRSDAVRNIAREMNVKIGADAVVGNTHNLNSSRIVRETVHSLEGLVMGLDLVDLGQLDPAEAQEWAASLTESTRKLNRFLRQLRETAQ